MLFFKGTKMLFPIFTASYPRHGNNTKGQQIFFAV